MARYVVLRHETSLPSWFDSNVHWDFMLEMDGRLRTWAIERWPLGHVPVRCIPLADHRLAYREYEGEISGGRGVVTRAAQGDFETQEISASRIVVRFQDDDAQAGEWLLEQDNTRSEWSIRKIQ